MTHSRHHHRADLIRIAIAALNERGLQPEFGPAVEAQAARLAGPADERGPHIRDLTALPWCSIDNDDSRDLDQLTACAPQPGGALTVWVAVADVDALVAKDSPIDHHAQANTTSIYTSARVFPMLPERLCTDLSSLNPGQERLGLVTEMVIAPDASIEQSQVYRARVRNQAQLAYDAVSAWLEGRGPLPEAARAVPGLEEQLRWQDEVAQRLRVRRHEQGSLELETFEPRALFDGEHISGLYLQPHNRARQLIEELMIATNTGTAQVLSRAGLPSLRRVVRSPERWQRLVELAGHYGTRLPREPDAQALAAFLARRHRADPLRFPDLSLVVVKLMGPGEYVVQGGGAPVGHFALALRDYTHSTAPNRRYPDLVTLRMMKAHLAGMPPPYDAAEMAALASHCTLQEDAVRRVERRVRKSEAALLLESRLGERFEAIVTGHSDDSTWVRTLDPPVEGKLVAGDGELEVGRTLRVKLVHTDVERGYIDFVRVA